MTDNPRLRQLLDELHETHATPEEVCRSCPELLPEVRARWRAVCRVQADVSALFPPPEKATPPPDGLDLPSLPGYEVEVVLGRGGMGIVFRASHVRLKRRVGLKMLLAGAYAAPHERARFQREAEAVAGLRHPNIVQVYDVGDSDGRPYFTMEYIEGGSLARHLAGAPQPAHPAAQLVATLAAAVQAAHERGIVHRDLKPGNVLLAADGTPKISDFGLARRQEEAGLTLTGVAVGTPSYMAPEQACGRSDIVGPATDIYGLGAILYELLTGRPPFRAATAAETVQQVITQAPAPPSQLNRQVPHDLETICLKCLNKEPSRRYGTAAELAGDLQRFQRGEPILARRAGPAERLVKWTMRHRSLGVSLVSGTVLLNVLVAVVVSVLVDRSVLTRTVEADFREVAEAQERQAWGDARSALERARGRLREGGPAELRQRADQLDRELVLVAKLHEIGLNHHEPESEASRTRETRTAYEAAFREAGLLDEGEGVTTVAERIRTTGVAPALLVALDQWARLDESRHDWLLEIAREVEPNSVSRQIRDAKAFDNVRALEELARTTPVESQTVPFLHSIGNRIHVLEGNPVPLLKRVQRAHPADFEANYYLGHVLLAHQQNPREAIGYFRAAVAIRPTAPRAHHNLGKALSEVGLGEEALEEIKEASRLSPGLGFYHHYAGVAYCILSRYDEAMPEFRKACDLEPRNALYLSGVGLCLTARKQYAEAIEVLRTAIALDAGCWEAHQRLRSVYLQLNQPEKARAAWREALARGPRDLEAWDGYAELSLFLKDEAEYRRTRKELLKRFGSIADPREAERVGRACLILPASEDELRQATKLIDRALASERAKPSWLLSYFRFAKALAEYRAGRLESTLPLLDGDTQRILVPAPRLLLAMVQHRLGKADAARDTFRAAVDSYAWDVKKAMDREAWMYHLLRREAEIVLASKPEG